MKTEEKEKRNIVECTPEEFVEIARGFETPGFAAGIFDTKVELNKFDAFNIVDENGVTKRNKNAVRNPYYDDGIRCVSKKFKLVTGFNYAKVINQRLVEEEKDPNFVPKDNWYTCVNPFLAVNKKDDKKFYFRYFYLPNSIIDMDYYFQGNDIDRMVFNQYVTDKSSNYKNQGLDNELMIQVVSVENIIELSFNGTTYVFKHNNVPDYRKKYIRETEGKEANEEFTIG